MKILFVSNGSNFKAAGGMEYHLIDITGWLNKNDVETALAIRKDTFLQRILLAGKPDVYPLSWTGMGKAVSFFQVFRAIRSFSPDIISINRERDIVPIFSIAKLAGIFLKKRPKIVSVFHNVGWKKQPFFLYRLDGMIFPNAYIKSWYIDNHCTVPSPVLHHGIHMPDIDAESKQDPYRKRRFFRDKSFPIIGMVGELRKNQSELVDVAYHLKRTLKNFTVAIVGRGNEEEVTALQEKINRLGLEQNFVLTGNVDRHSIPDIFYDLDVSVTTNRREPFGMVFLESLASMTPLVAYDSGGPVEIIEKGGGKLVSGGPEQMASVLHRIITNHEERLALGAAGRESIEKNFSIEAMGKRHLDFYRHVLTSS